jgi:hypothetical protein
MLRVIKIIIKIFTVKIFKVLARCPWLTPIILAMQEAEIRRIVV